MERRIKNNTKSSSTSSNDSKEKKFRKSDTFKEMKRRISSSFGKLNLIKDDGVNKERVENDTSENDGACQKRSYSSTAIHEVSDIDNNSRVGTSQTTTPVKTNSSSISGSISFFQKASWMIFKRGSSTNYKNDDNDNNQFFNAFISISSDNGVTCTSTISDNIEHHKATRHNFGDLFRNLWKRSSLKRNQEQHRSLGNVNSVFSVSNDSNQNQKALPPQPTNQKQGPAAKISAKLRSRRGTSSKQNSNHTNNISTTAGSVCPLPRPHSVARDTTSDHGSDIGVGSNNKTSIMNQAVQFAMSNYQYNNNIKDPMSTSLVLSRPKSDGHCFEGIMTNSITTDQQDPKSHNHHHQNHPYALNHHHHHPNHLPVQSNFKQQKQPITRSRRFASTSGVMNHDEPSSHGDESPRQHSFGRTDSYQKLDMLGEGSYATVFKGHSNLTGQTVALKEIRINPEEGVPFTAIREASLLKNLRHANIVILHDIVHTKESLTFVFEFVHSDLSKYIERRQPHGIRPLNIKLLLFQLLRGLHFCHQRRILHRDLKPQNLLISEQGELKLADFGLARAKSVPSRTYSNEVVTLWYRPPDVLLGSTEYNASLDMWGVGCIFVEMIGGTAIFPGLKDTDDQLDKIFKIMGSPNERVWPGVTSLPHYTSFLLSRKPHTNGTTYHHKGRPLHRVIHRLYGLPHAESLALAFLQIRPELRVLARPAMAHPYFEDLPRQLLHLPDTSSIFTVPGVRMVPESPISPLITTSTAPGHHRQYKSQNHHNQPPQSGNLSSYQVTSSTAAAAAGAQPYHDPSHMFIHPPPPHPHRTSTTQEDEQTQIHPLIKQDWKTNNNFFNTTVQ